jgi:hypothetical protein
MSSYRICRDDGISDGIAGQVFDSYDAAYAVVERYYADVCCSVTARKDDAAAADQAATAKVTVSMSSASDGGLIQTTSG